MFLPGSLRTTTLGDLLGRLHRQQVSGILELIEERASVAGRRHHIHLQHGLITKIETPVPVPPLGEVLRQEGALTALEHRSFLERLRSRPGCLAGTVLLEAGVVTAQRIAEALATQMRLRVDALFELEDASVRFHVGGVATGRSLPASEVLQGRPRARDRRGGARPVGARDRHNRETPGQTTMQAQALATLGLGQGATRDQIRHAFRRLAPSVHPDLHPEADVHQRTAMQSKFASLSSAYHYLITQA